MTTMRQARARADQLDHGLTADEATAWRRMCSKLRRAGHLKRKRAWEARALQWIYSLRFTAWYNALEPSSSTAVAMAKDAIWHARRIEQIEAQTVEPKRERRRQGKPADPLA